MDESKCCLDVFAFQELDVISGPALHGLANFGHGTDGNNYWKIIVNFFFAAEPSRAILWFKRKCCHLANEALWMGVFVRMGTLHSRQDGVIFFLQEVQLKMNAHQLRVLPLLSWLCQV